MCFARPAGGFIENLPGGFPADLVPAQEPDPVAFSPVFPTVS
jgi:hypothetical protein